MCGLFFCVDLRPFSLYNGSIEKRRKDRYHTMNRLWNQAARFVLSRIHKTGLEQELNRAELSGKLSVPEIAEKARLLAAEGIVLLKNEKHTLPITADTRLAVFGRSAIDYFTVGYGSGGDVIAPYRKNLMEGLLEQGVNIDGRLASLYETWCSLPRNVPDEGYWGHWPMSNPEMPLKEADVAEAAQRNNLALVVIGRAAGEARENVLKPGSYYLTDREKAMLKLVTRYFDRVCVVMDCGNIIDMGWTLDFGDKISAIVYAWQGGMESGRALADVLTGRVNPCGKLTDTIASCYDDYPSSQSFGNRDYNPYTEDIYVGYRYFETFAPEKVLYPFGFGLSYTRFNLTSTASVSGNTVTVRTRVENTGDEAGREVVQVYVDLPCGKLGNPKRVLAGFQKTGMLQPGLSETVSVSFRLEDLASYDDTGATGHANCFVLEEGSYCVQCGSSIRDVKPVVCLVKQELELIKTLHEVNAVRADNAFCRMVNREGKLDLEQVSIATRDLRKAILEQLPEEFTKPEKEFSFRDVRDGLCTPEEFVAQLTDQELDDITHGYGLMNDPEGPAGNAGSLGGVTESLKNRGIPRVITTDGPSGIRVRKTCSLLPCGTCLASTFDPAAVESLYQLLGKEMVIQGTQVLLGPGMNIHRDPLCGRNFEYYSEDPLLTGKLAAAMIRGIQSQGVSACPKHFACNNQEENRHECDSRVSQRAQREIYLKGFEIAVKESDPWCLMTSYNLVNGVWSHYHYELVTEILRGEWGYNGVVITDWWMHPGASPEFPNITNDAYRIRAQVDVLMPGQIEERTLPASLQDPQGVTRAEAQRCAVNVIKFILKLGTV